MELSWTQRMEAMAFARGFALAIVALLQKRGFQLTEEQRSTLDKCRDLALLESWLHRAAQVSSVDELLPHEKQAAEAPSEKAQALEDRLDEAYQHLAALLEKRTQNTEDAELQERVRLGFEEVQALKREQLEAVKAAYQERLKMPLTAGQDLLDYANKLLQGEDTTSPDCLTSQN